MGRTLPTECHHGTIIDWGDFGPCQGYCEEVHPDLIEECPDLPGCDQCRAEAEEVTDDLRNRIAKVCEPTEVYTAADGLPVMRVRSADEIADAVLAVLAPKRERVLGCGGG